ncbi:MAG: hypothetical protein R2788_02275 [Saprospiraceae bacterium]
MASPNNLYHAGRIDIQALIFHLVSPEGPVGGQPFVNRRRLLKTP